MNKGMGRSQQIRGHKRRQKTLNRRLNRNPSDFHSINGKYAEWLDAKIKREVDEMVENEKRNNS